MFTHYRFLLKKVNAGVPCLPFFSSIPSPVSAEANPTSLFRLYNPYFSAAHFLPIEIGNNNKVFSWPQALMKSIRSEIEHIKSDTITLSQELKEKERIVAPTEPLKKATHLMSLSRLYLELLEIDKCEVLLESAIQILRSLSSLESAKLTSDAYQQLAITKQLKEEYSIAVTYYKEALKYSAKAFRGHHHPSQAQLYAMLGMAYATIDQPAEFENCYQQIITSMKTCFSDSPNRWVNFESNLAIIYQRQGRYHDAILLHEGCCQIYSKAKSDRISAPIEKINWAATLIANNDLTQAKKLLEDAENSLTKLPDMNPNFIKIIGSNLAICTQPYVTLPKSGMVHQIR